MWDKKDEEEVLAALNSGGWGICPEPNAVSRLKRRFAEEHHAKHALCCCNGTVGLMIALRSKQHYNRHNLVMKSISLPGPIISTRRGLVTIRAIFPQSPESIGVANHNPQQFLNRHSVTKQLIVF